MLASRLFDTPLIVVPGMSQEQLDAEWDAMITRAKMTQKLIDGAIDWEVYFDFMREQGYEPEELLDQAAENLDFAIREGLVIER